MSKRLFPIMFQHASRKTGCSRPPPDPPRPHGYATAAPHSSTRCPRRKNGRRLPTRRWGGRGKEPSRQRVARYPARGRIRGKGGVSDIFGGVSLPVYLVSCPLLGVSIARNAFLFRGWNNAIPPRIIFSNPRVCWLSGRPTLCPQASGLSLAYCRFFFLLFIRTYVYHACSSTIVVLFGATKARLAGWDG